MEHVVYILYSRKYEKTYIGCTSNIVSRFHSHNTLATKGWTRRYRTWEVAHMEFFSTKNEAMKREKWFKTGSGRRYKDILIQELLK
ncbi:GIY-YIG nuclease family protein [Patiriisocius sp. Uisw_047]|jgi:putative endonuclease|uniref:GIY-YIG nuclease family protein n=1 Tax=Patiriisocius sp. Uisw_047 TaxID=3230969 RepID=UPI0039ED4A53